MSSDRSNNTTAGRSLKPTLASTRTSRTPLTPRIAGNATPTSAVRPAAPKATGTTRSEPPRLTPRVKQQEDTPTHNNIATAGPGNVTPRSSARNSRVDDSQTPPQSEDTPSVARPRNTIVSTNTIAERNATGAGGLGISAGAGLGGGVRVGRPKSMGTGGGSVLAKSPLVRPPSIYDLGTPSIDESLESRFFHASDAKKQQEPVPKKPELKKTPTFYYADGHEEERQRHAVNPTLPTLSAGTESRPTVPWMRNEIPANYTKSSPMLSPALSSVSSASPFFPASAAQQLTRSPSPSKENNHLSYRKGASQILGTMPLFRPAPISGDVPTISEESRSGLDSSHMPHKKSPSLSSIDSGNSQHSRRRSATIAEASMPSPLTHEVKSATMPPLASPPRELSTIDTSFGAPDLRFPPPERALSPTKAVSDLAADARRERKVLDLEISNSSLLAINSSLEREVRRQRIELKRFRRLSRAGRFSLNSTERSARFSEGLSTLGEDNDEVDEDLAAEFGPSSGLTDRYDDFSDDDDEEDESVASGASPLSVTSSRANDRLAKDEKRLKVDLERHKELLVQSQMTNQTIKRCMYATEEMIAEGKKSLLYHVRVSDVKLGGRILTGNEDEDESTFLAVEDGDGLEGDGNDDMESAHGLLQVWQGVGRPSFESSEGGDRDSGIEVDKAPHVPLRDRLPDHDHKVVDLS